MTATFLLFLLFTAVEVQPEKGIVQATIKKDHLIY